MKKRNAKNEQCVVCNSKADVFWPVIDTHIDALPYCNDCLKVEEEKLLKALKEAKDGK